MNELVERSGGVLLLVVLPEKPLELALELGPVVCFVSVEEFNDVLGFGGAVIGDPGAFLGVGEAEILALNVPATKELGNVGIVEVKGTRLPRARHDRAVHAWHNG